MKRVLILTLIALTLVGLAFAMMTRGESAEWTTNSDTARAEFELGLESMMKFYHYEANRHFEKALELDPSFVAAQLMLVQSARDAKRRDEMLGNLREAELSNLTDRERFLVRHALAKSEQDHAGADALISEYLEQEPEDPFVLMTCSAEAWEERDLERAALHYQKLVESNPNWANAQNRLGYIAMAQGKFQEAEEAFRKYHFVAPDQANPHDSMGELMTLLGRYDEATVSFEKALEIKPDFCQAHYHLVDMFVMAGRFDNLEPAMAAARENCGDEFGDIVECATIFWMDYGEGEYERAFSDERTACRETMRKVSPFILHRLAVSSGRFEIAGELEQKIRTHLEEYESGAFEPETDGTRGLLLHMEAVRFAAQGDFETAQGKLLQADDHLLYWGNSQGILKLFNLLSLSELMRRTGDEEAADAIYDKVHSVNAPFAEMVARGGGALRGSVAGP